jgi:hypothetical protein
MNMMPNPIDTRRRLLATAAAMLAKCPSVPSAAVAMEQILVADRLMLRAMITDFLTGVREAEMRGGGRLSPDAHPMGDPAAQPHGDGDGRIAFDARDRSAPLSPPNDEAPAVYPLKTDPCMPAASSPSEEPSAEGDMMPVAYMQGGSSLSDAAAGHSSADVRVLRAPAASPSHDRAGQLSCEPQVLAARPVVSPNPTKRTLASVASVQPTMRRTVLDTFKVRDGRAVGDLLWRGLTVFARENEIEGRVLRAIAAHVANADPEAKVRAVVKAEVVEAAIRSAKELAHV